MRREFDSANTVGIWTRSVRLAFVPLIVCATLLFCRLAAGAYAKSDWQAEWDQTVRAAEKEGQVTVTIGGYGAIIDSGIFQKAYPKIKITHITGAGTDLTQRISAERRAGKYLVCRLLLEKKKEKRVTSDPNSK